MPKKRNLERYAEIKNTIRDLQEEENYLKGLIQTEMQEEGMDKESTEFGTFTLARRVSYTYSDKIKEMEEKLKMKKHTEEEKGIAKSNTTEYLLFRPVKNEQQQS